MEIVKGGLHWFSRFSKYFKGALKQENMYWGSSRCKSWDLCECEEALFTFLDYSRINCVLPCVCVFVYLRASGAAAPVPCRLTCSLVVRPRATSTIWKPVSPKTGMKKSPAIHITTILDTKVKGSNNSSSGLKDMNRCAVRITHSIGHQLYCSNIIWKN